MENTPVRGAQKQGPPEEQSMPCLAPEKGPIRVLIVDDETLGQRTLGQLLQREGYCCAFAENGAEALQLVQSFQPQAILMDLRMPVLDGFEATRRLKADEQTRAIPVLALTGSTTPQDRNQAALAGVDDFLTKPINIDLLLRQLHKFLAAEPSASEPTEDATKGEVRRSCSGSC
jgi:CheY-like chemotaxis protein